MKLQSIRLHPFAGIADKTYSFNNSLTVICAPNEEGKSTVANAIQQVLFLETNLTPSKKRDYLKDWMPVNGGDTICITLKFMSNDHVWTLEKQWGARSSVKLSGSDGITFAEDGIVQNRIQEMLPASQAVVEQILIASQSRLADAISNLTNDVKSSLSEKLVAQF
jgi:exonuclease SbcC